MELNALGLNPSDWLLLWRGLLTTLEITALTLLISLPLGAVLGTIRFLNFPVISNAIGGFIDSLRSIPLVLYIVVLFLVVPLPAKVLAVLALSSYTATSIAEIIRGGLLSIDVSQLEAGKILGMTLKQRMLHIALPQASQRMLPALVSQASVVVKDTTLVSIGVLELTKAVNVLNMRHLDLSIEFMILVAASYFILCYGICLMGRWLEFRLIPACQHQQV